MFISAKEAQSGEGDGVQLNWLVSVIIPALKNLVFGVSQPVRIQHHMQGEHRAQIQNE